MSLTLTNPLRPALLAAARSERIERTLSRSRLTRSLVTRFVPGAAEDAVMDAVRKLLADGRAISVDYLGEDISEAAEAETTVNAYLSLLAAYRRLELPATNGARRLEISIKLSALGQSLPGGEELALVNARIICQAAAEAGAWVNVDAEDHTTTDSTLAIVRELRREFPDVATVLQAYLHRTEADCADAVRHRLPDPPVQGGLLRAGRGRLPGQGRGRRLLPPVPAGTDAGRGVSDGRLPRPADDRRSTGVRGRGRSRHRRLRDPDALRDPGRRADPPGR